MTALSSRRAGAVQGPQRAATGPEPSSGVGPAFSLGEPEPPLRSDLELGALPTVVPCARLHARHVLREWGSNGLAPDSELLVSELVTNAVKATAGRDGAAVRLRLSGDSARVLIEVWDADPQAPASKDLGRSGQPAATVSPALDPPTATAADAGRSRPAHPALSWRTRGKPGPSPAEDSAR